MDYYTKEQLHDFIYFLTEITKKIRLSAVSSSHNSNDNERLFENGILLLKTRRKLPVELVNNIVMTLLRLTPFLDKELYDIFAPLTPTDSAKAIFLPNVIEKKYRFEEKFSLQKIRAFRANAENSKYKNLLLFLFPEQEFKYYSFLYSPLCKLMACEAADDAQSFCSHFVKMANHLDDFNWFLANIRALRNLYLQYSNNIEQTTQNINFQNLLAHMRQKADQKISISTHLSFTLTWISYHTNFSRVNLYFLKNLLEPVLKQNYAPVKYFFFRTENKSLLIKNQYLHDLITDGYSPALCDLGILFLYHYLIDPRNNIINFSIDEIDIEYFFPRNRVKDVFASINMKLLIKPANYLFYAYDHLLAAAHKGYARAEYYFGLVLAIMASKELTIEKNREINALSLSYFKVAAGKNYAPAIARLAMLKASTHTQEILNLFQKEHIYRPKLYFSYANVYLPGYCLSALWLEELFDLLKEELKRYVRKNDVLERE